MEHTTTDTNTRTNKETEHDYSWKEGDTVFTTENTERLKQMNHIYHHFTTARESLVEVATDPHAGLVIEDADEREQFIRDMADLTILVGKTCRVLDKQRWHWLHYGW